MAGPGCGAPGPGPCHGPCGRGGCGRGAGLGRGHGPLMLRSIPPGPGWVMPQPLLPTHQPPQELRSPDMAMAIMVTSVLKFFFFMSVSVLYRNNHALQRV